MSHRMSHSVVTPAEEAQLNAGDIDSWRGFRVGESIDNLSTERRNLSTGGAKSTDRRRPIGGSPNRQPIVNRFAGIVNLAASIPKHWGPLMGRRFLLPNRPVFIREEQVIVRWIRERA